MTEQFRPVTHHPPIGFINSILFYGRMFLDFQLYTLYKHIKRVVPNYEGKVLDVGCGNSPFKFLINTANASYIGIDIDSADNFDYNNSEKINFNGENIPFENESFENVISTEVLEHIENPEIIIDEIFRVLKPEGNAFISIPWSARVHYAPYDFCRYTPYKLEKLFSKFKKADIIPRGTDINSIVSKIVVVFIGLFISSLKPISFKEFLLSIFKIVLFFLFFPLFPLIILIGHLELLLKIGSANDPLGYSIFLKK